MSVTKMCLPLILLVTNLLNSAEGNQESCEHRWEDGHHVDLGCLWMEKTSSKLKFSQAKNYCNKQNARLVEIATAQQMSFLVTKLQEKCDVICDWWGGASKKISGGLWFWEESGNLVDPLIWVGGKEPTNLDSDFQYRSCFNTTLGYQGSACRGINKLLPICQRKYFI